MRTLLSGSRIAVAAALMGMGLSAAAIAHPMGGDNSGETLISKQQARTAARQFLRANGLTSVRQSSHAALVKGAELRGDTWVVSVSYGGPIAAKNRGVVLVDAATGQIRDDLN